VSPFLTLANWDLTNITACDLKLWKNVICWFWMHNLADIILLPLVCFGIQQMLDFLETKCVILCNWLDVHDISKLFRVRFCGHIVLSASRYRPVLICAIFLVLLVMFWQYFRHTVMSDMSFKMSFVCVYYSKSALWKSVCRQLFDFHKCDFGAISVMFW